VSDEDHEKRLNSLEKTRSDDARPQPFYGHALSWPARTSLVCMALLVAFLLIRVGTEGSRTKHIAQGAASAAVKAQDKSNSNAVTLQQVQDRIDNFGRIFCGQQDALRGLPTHFPPQNSAVGTALVGSVLKIQRSGEIVYIQLKCPAPAAGIGSTPTPTPTPTGGK
jgi:hypothetical protein